MKSELTLAALSVAVTVSVLWVVLIVVERRLGMEDSRLRYENEVEMWQEDAEIGFTNQPGFDAVAWGSVPIQTNEQGFRGTAPTSAKKAEGVTRIVGLGDSVMWGTGVAAEASIVGQLEGLLETEGATRSTTRESSAIRRSRSCSFYSEPCSPSSPTSFS